MSEHQSDTPQKIDLDELQRRIDDLDVPIDQIAPYLIRVPSSIGSIDPEFQPNPSLVTGLDTGLEGMGVTIKLNKRRRAERNRKYRERINSGWSGVRIVDEGDSWFQYPALGLLGMKDIVDHLSDTHAVYSLSGAGHRLADMIRQNEVIATIRRENSQVLIMSAGGNDLFDNGKIAELVEVRPEGFVVGAKFDGFVSSLMSDYGSFLLRVHQTFPHIQIFMHGYASAFSRGDRWIGQPLRNIGIRNRNSQNAVVRGMLGKFNDALIRLASDHRFHGKLTHVDLRGLGQSRSDWWDEIHMGGAANGKAAGLFAAAIDNASGDSGLEGVAAAPAEAEESPAEAVTAHAEQLMRLDEAVLLAELQERLSLIDADPAAASLPSAPLLVMQNGLETTGLPAVGPLARRLLARWERELYDLICGTADDDTETREKLRKALGVDPDALIGIVAGWLVSGPLGVSALLAGVLAAILVKRFGSATVEVVCDTWKGRLAIE